MSIDPRVLAVSVLSVSAVAAGAVAVASRDTREPLRPATGGSPTPFAVPTSGTARSPAYTVTPAVATTRCVEGPVVVRALPSSADYAAVVPNVCVRAGGTLSVELPAVAGRRWSEPFATCARGTLEPVAADTAWAGAGGRTFAARAAARCTVRSGLGEPPRGDGSGPPEPGITVDVRTG